MKTVSGIVAGFLMPHPPIIIPDVGRGNEADAKATIDAMHLAAKKIAELKPDAIVLLSPHAPLFSDYAFIYGGKKLEGSMRRFGAGTALSFAADSELAGAIVDELDKAGVEAGNLDDDAAKRYGIDGSLDHGAFVPLYFIKQEYAGFSLVVLSPSASPKVWPKLGTAIAGAVKKVGRRAVVVASGDLSHRVNENSPYGALPEGAEFDNALVRLLKANDAKGVLEMDRRLREKAGECGYGSLSALIAAMGEKPQISVLSYEAPFGIGYCVASFMPQVEAEQRTGSAHVALAKEAIRRYVLDGETVELDEVRGITAAEHDLTEKAAGVFVSLKKRGNLRGCIGTISPVHGCIANEIINNAIAAAAEDPRFYPVSADELDELDVSVDVLGKPEIATRDELDPKRYGVIVSKGMRRGLLLPDLEGVDTVEQQLEIACKKAGIDPHGAYSIQRFKVTRYY